MDLDYPEYVPPRELTAEEHARIDAFIADLVAVCRKHGLTIEPGDVHAGTTVYPIRAGDARSLDAIVSANRVPLD